jgi:large subunit ribosomal protein L15
MSLNLNTLQKDPRSAKPAKRVGRGSASGKGTFSGRGCKGQRSRSGGKKGLKYKGMKRMIANAPKFKGMKPLVAKEQNIDLSMLNKYFKADEVVTPAVLFQKKLIKNPEARVKILSSGEIDHAVIIDHCLISAKAKSMIEKAGGSVNEAAVKVEEEKV